MRSSNLGGHSGCMVLLCEENDNTAFVRKIAGSPDYNERLKTQAVKQEKFKSEHLKTPSVIRKGYTDEGLFYFDMEYVRGITLAEYIRTIEIGRIRGYVELLLKDIVEITDHKTGNPEIFMNKIISLRPVFEHIHSKTACRALKLLAGHDWSRFCFSDCHGDLTLENIIVKDGQLWLIDFLDSFYNCWILDVSTLMQDVQTMWSYRNEQAEINTLIRLIIFRDMLMEKIQELSGNLYIEVYYALLLKLLRIFPYTHDISTLSFLEEKVKSVTEIIEKAERADL